MNVTSPIPSPAKTATAIRVPGGNFNLPPMAELAEKSDEYRKLEESLHGLNKQERKRVLRALIRAKRFCIAKLTSEHARSQENLDRIDTFVKDHTSFCEWAKGGFSLQKCEHSEFRSFRKDIAHGRALHAGVHPEESFPSAEYEKEVFRFAEVFLVQHNWAAAFAKAKDFDGVFRLPFETSVFEFQISGRRVLALATECDGRIGLTPAIKINEHWMLPPYMYWERSGQWEPERIDFNTFGELAVLIGAQIRAACIALDAEVATASLQREVHSPSQNKSNIFASGKPYHVVSLARSEKSERLPVSTETGKRICLHFRRGHWRHYSAHKTWIKWTLVGDPDLGFVDKEYRL